MIKQKIIKMSDKISALSSVVLVTLTEIVAAAVITYDDVNYT